jgi:flagellar biosynthesis GTPase FlhF
LQEGPPLQNDNTPNNPTSRNNAARENIKEDLPPLPKSAPKLRQETIQSLSEQQLEVIELARPPTTSYFSGSVYQSGIFNNDEATQQPQQGYMVRVTAAAGTGKTTMLLHLAIRCLDLGHTDVAYVTFSRAAASDAKNELWK